MNNFRATPEQWAGIKKDSRFQLDSCILELRARVEALEAQAGNYPVIPDSSTPPTVATDEELYRIWESKKTDNWDRRRVIYNLGVAHGQAGSRKVAEPAPVAGGLVERVRFAIDSTPFDEDDHQWHEDRSAILEVARWLREQGAFFTSADLLEQEAGR